MSLTPATIIHGLRDFPITHPKVTHRANGMDSVTQIFQARERLTFARGGLFPGLNHFYITESEPVTEVPGEAHEVLVRGEGLEDGQDREEENGVETPEDGWDSGPMSILTVRPDRYEIGRVHPHIETLWAVALQKRRVCGPRNSMAGVWRVSGDFKGIVPISGEPKPRKRRITVGNQVLSSSDAITLGYTAPGVSPFKNESGTFTGWEDARYTALDSSRVQVSDTFLTWTAPPTDDLPGHLTPDNAPAVFDIFNTAWWTASNFIWNWPWGWTLKAINSEPLLYGMVGTPYLTTITTEYVPRAVPK